MFALEFEIEGLPKIITNGSHGHWRVRHNEALKWKGLVANAVLLQKERAARPLTKATLCLTRYSAREPDFDGLVSSFKHCIDGLKEAGVITDDKQSVIGQPTYLWVYAKPKQGKIKVKVEEA